MSSIRMNTHKWIESKLPRGLEVRQVYGFIFSSDGRILLLEDEGRFNERFAQVRLVALVDQIRRPAADSSTGRHYTRFWVPPTHSNGLLKWGTSGDEQVASAIAAVSMLGISWGGNPLTRIEIN